MQSSNLSRSLMALLAGGALAVGLCSAAGADSPYPVSGPYSPTNLPGGAGFVYSPAAAYEMGQANGTASLFYSIPLAGSNDLGVWWGSVSNQVKLSFVNENFSGVGEVLSFDSTNSDLAIGKVVWNGQTTKGGAPVQTRCTMTLSSWPTPPDNGYALQFDGVDDYVVSQKGVDLAGKSFTIEAWAQRNSSDTMDLIIGQDAPNQILMFGFHYYGGNQFDFDFYGDGVASGTLDVDNAWHHWAGTYDASTRARCLYRDGSLIASNVALANYQGSGPLRLGVGYFGEADNYFNGQVDEVRVWRGVRTPTEIAANMSQRLAGTETNLLLYWKFDEGSGTFVHDSSSNGNNATFVSAPKWTSVSSRGSCLLFDGLNDNFVINRPVSNDFTIECSFRTTQKAGGSGYWYQGVGLVGGEVAGMTRDFGITIGQGQLFFGVGGTSDITIAGGNVADGQWHNVAATRQRSTGAIVLYLDGNLVTNGVAGTNTLDVPQKLYIGSTTSSGGWFQGLIDEVRFWNTNRSQAEIRATLGRSLTGTEPGLVAYYRLDEGVGATAQDGTGHGYDGTINGAAWYPQPWGQALSFDGVDDYALSQQNVPLNNSSFTIEAWARRTTGAGHDCILGQGTPSGSSGLYFGFVDNNTFGMIFFGNDLNTTEAYKDSNWHHWAGTYNAQTKERYIYRDGLQVAYLNDLARSHYQGTGRLHVGVFPGRIDWCFGGQLDEVRVWNVARNQNEIQRDMRRSLSGAEPSLLLYYRFDEGQGNAVYDSSANWFTGDLYNGPNRVPSAVPLNPAASAPLALLPATALGLSTNVGAVLRVTNGTAFSANMRFEASTNKSPFYPAADISFKPYMNFQGGFYYGGKPVITNQPVSVGTMARTDATFSSSATGFSLAYRWLDSINLASYLAGATNLQVLATNSTFSLTNVQYNGSYVLVVTNPVGTAISMVANLSVTNLAGREIKPPPEADLTRTPSYDRNWASRDPASGALYACNTNGLFSITWFDTNGIALARSVYLQSIPAVQYSVGSEIPWPGEWTNGWTLRKQPDVSTAGATYWHAASQRLFAVGLGVASITWYGTNESLHLGDQRQVTVQNAWPTNASRYQIYIAGSPGVSLSNNWSNANARLLGCDGSVDADSEVVQSSRLFQAPKTGSHLTGVGNSLLLLSQGNPDQTTDIYFQFVKSIAWDDPNYLRDHAPGVIGESITNDYGYHTASYMPVHLPSPFSPYCPNFFDPRSGLRRGNLIPVNKSRSDTNAYDMAVVFYAEGSRLWQVFPGTQTPSSIAWPYQAVRYDCQWPTNTPTITIASEKGTGPIQLDDWDIYVQNDPNQPGFNPNDEHALKLKANGALPQLRLNPTALMVQEGGSNQVEVWLTSQPPTNVHFTLSALPGGNTNLSSPSLGSTNVIAATNWQTRQTVQFTAAHNTATNLARTFVLQAWGGLFATNQLLVCEAQTNQPELVLDALSFSIDEGTNRSISVRLSAQPAQDVVVQIVPTGEFYDPSLVVDGTNSLTIARSAWNQPQVFKLKAEADPEDVADALVTFRVDASGGVSQSREVTVTALDANPGPYAAFALRDDLGTSRTSDPYVLIAYRTGNGEGAMKVFRVEATNSNYTFNYRGMAGNEITPPYPLSTRVTDYVDWAHSFGTAGPWWRDRKGHCWAKAAGDDGVSTCGITMKFFYRFQDDGFFFPDGITRTNNTPVAWLDHRGGDTNGIDVRYTIEWPNLNVPYLKLGETLVWGKRQGDFDVYGQESAAVVYQQAEAQGRGSSVVLIDPITECSVPLDAPPRDVATSMDPMDGKVYFTALPPHLRSRVWHEKGPSGGSLHFKGELRNKPEDSSTEEPKGYLLVNVMSGRDQDSIIGRSADLTFISAVNALAVIARPRLVGSNDLNKPMALTAGSATAEGYVTLVFNNGVRVPDFPADRGTPILMQLLKVRCPLYQGAVKPVYSDDPFDEKVALRHTGDFGGCGDQYRFEWQYRSRTDTNWTRVSTIPDDGRGASDTVVPGLEGGTLRAFVDGYYQCRYRSLEPNHPCGSNWSEWTTPAPVEGWAKRFVAKIDPYHQRFSNLMNHNVDLTANIISQAGARWIGDIPFNQAALDGKGLIEIYESVLRRGIKLSIESSPPAQPDQLTSQALLTVARRLADLYMVLGNEAYADASDPTIAFGTDGQYGEVASSIYCFMDQVPSLIEEELGLLRGLTPDYVDIRRYPAYNRLRWNFTRNMTGGEVAYALNYNIRDPSGNIANTISGAAAQALYPQGHGDAWGHYLTACKNYYRLLRNTNFVWSSQEESVTVLGDEIHVGYADERKFAQAAAAKARTGAEIVNLTYREAYVDKPTGQWQGYLDPNTNRAWGVSEWACRAGQGAIFDWVTANALLPANNTNTGPAKVDRTSVTELRDIVGQYGNIQQELDKADTGLNPLGLAKNVLPFDIDPQAIVSGKTQFEQVYERAVTAMNNAIAVFNYAANCSQLLRRQADNLAEFQQTVTDRETDFTNRLVEVFGRPYPDDPNYSAGYRGPDLYNYFVSDYSEISGQSQGASVPVSVNYVETLVAEDGSLTQVSRPVTYHLAGDGSAVKDPFWTGQREAPGEVQNAHSDLLMAKARFEKALAEYDNLLRSIQDQATLLEAIHRLNSEEITLLYKGKGLQEQLNHFITRAVSRQYNWTIAARSATAVANAAAEALPRSVGFACDVTSVGRSLIMLAGAAASEVLMYKANQESMAELDLQQAKEMAQAQQNIELTVIKQNEDILSRIAQLQELVREEVLKRLDIYEQQEAMQQMAGRYRAAVVRGQALYADWLRFRQQTAAHVQEARYKDMAFRIFRNEALQKYRAQFDLAAMYVYLTAKAYDYETNLRPDDPAGPGAEFISQIVRARTIGHIESGLPQTGTEGDGGLADVMARMSGNFSVLKPQLGLNNPQETALVFSLSKECLRCLPGSKEWRSALAGFRVDDLNQVAEFRERCLFENPDPEPGLVIPLPTTVNKGLNYFGWPYGPADNKFNETASSIKIYSVGVSFSNYRITGDGGMANTPYIYFVPVGNDMLRCPRSSVQETNRFTRVWTVLDQWLPVPFNLRGAGGASVLSSLDYTPAFEVQPGEGFLGQIRRFPAFRAWHDSLLQSETDAQFNTTLLISRSVWNTKWLLVIPASSLGYDYKESLDRFIYGGIINPATGARDNNGVTDIYLRIKGYWYSGR